MTDSSLRPGHDLEVEPPRSGLEVADILRSHGEAYSRRHPLSARQAVVIRHLTQCRTASLGGHVDACDACGYQRISYNSCRDRHCPKCQGVQRERWIQTRLERLLPVEYYHVVFTVPQQLNPLMLRNQAVTYSLLFEAASKTLLQLAADPKRLGAQIGVTAILHTWGQNLLFHPHLHCVVTGGGLAPQEDRWIHTRQGYFMPVKVLSRMFRGKFLAALQRAYEQGRLNFSGSTAALTDAHRFAALKDTLYHQPWVVYAKRPFGGADHVFRYLGRYSHRVAITNRRLVDMDDDHVRFRYKDYADSSRHKTMNLSADEFIRRFLLHVLPKRFVRIRHYGLMASRHALTKLVHCRKLLQATNRTGKSNDADPPAIDAGHLQPQTPAEPDAIACPCCGGKLMRYELQPDRHNQHRSSIVDRVPVAIDDSS